MRVAQGRGERGSLKWIQRAVNDRPFLLDEPILAGIPKARSIAWKSPLRNEDFAEYRDGAVLGRLGLDSLNGELSQFWPARGPQWDALALTDRGQPLLLEAKAHIPEMLSPGSQASDKSRKRIDAALAETAAAMGAVPKAPWSVAFYQLANRFAALHFLVQRGVDAYLVFANFVGDADMSGPNNEAEWRGAYLAAHYALGIPARHIYSKRVIHIHPPVAELDD